MKSPAKPLLVVFSFLICFCSRLNAQYETAADYMEHIYKANVDLTQTYLTYLSAVSHGKSARKVEKRRQEVIKSIDETRFDIMGMPPYKGDRSLKDSTVGYLKMLNYIFNEQYGKIVNMEEIAEQSYDAMEAYLMAQEKAQEKLEEAFKRQHATQKKFAEKNNIKLVDSESEIEAKMKVASQVLDHNNETYLVFFKCYKQEGYLIDAIDRKNLVSLEQNISTLQKFANEGMEKLKAMKGYNDDPAMINATTEMMNFYKREADKCSGMSDFFLAQENFEKLKKQFDAKSRSQRTQQDIDKYNKAVNETNDAMKEFNKTNNDLNKARASALNNWNKVNKDYMDQYMPVQRK